MTRREAEIHFELYRHLKNALEERSEYHGIEFGEVSPEQNVNGGLADIVVKDRRGKPFLVIEAKRRIDGGYDRNLDPYSPKVIKQAFEYAGALGSEYFATYNGAQLVLFRTHERGVPLLERRARAYKVTDPQKFASELLEQVAGIEKGEVKWEPKPDTFVKRLKGFHDRLTQELPIKLEEKLKEPSFKTKFVNWINKQGWDIEEREQKSRFASQAAYLLMNKLFFYKVLEDTGHDVPDLPLEKLVDPKERRKAFDKIVENVDFKAIYEHDLIFDEIPLTKRASLEVGEFLEELDNYNLGEFKHDTIGYIYEDTIPPKIRHDLGQYYTPPKIVELITRLTIKNPEDKVLDPGCGSGTFLITAYSILKELREEANLPAEHEKLLDQIYGIDVNRFPAQLTTINLALQNLGAKTEQVNVEVQDFFNVWPNQGRLAVEYVDPFLAKEEGSWGEKLNVPPEVDVVVANPPYIRQEIIPDKKLCRKHLKRVGYENMSERSDIYAYFFTHATEFLRANGRIGFITSDKWLTVGYGEDLQNFFLDNFKIKTIISFSHRVFETPLVPTCITILEKSEDEEERASNIVKFIRIKGNLNLEELVTIVEDSYKPNILQEKEDYRLISIKQGNLKGLKKWDRYLYAPAIYWKILKHEKICELSSDNITAEIERAPTTGANSFFCLRKEDVESWGLAKYVTPLLKASGQMDHIEFRKEDKDEWGMLDVHSFVEKAVKKIGDTSGLRKEESLSKEIKKKLLEMGEKSLVDYIKFGESRGYHERPTCKSRKVWFDLGKIKRPPLFFPRFTWAEYRVIYAKNKAVATNQFYIIQPKRGIDDKVLAGVLNSSIAGLFAELHGRTEGGEGMNRNEIAAYEVKGLPILDISQLSDLEKNRIKESFEHLIEAEKENKNLEKAKLDLDKAVLAPLGLETQAKKILSYFEGLIKARREGKEVSEMIAGVEEEVETGELEGAEIVSEKIGQQKLDEF